MSVGNAIVSTYQTNCKYLFHWNSTSYLNAEPEMYDEYCSCALQINCTSEAFFTQTNSSMTIALQGLKNGCAASQALLSSTLQCFYNQSCVQIIKQYTNTRYSLQLVSMPITNQSRIHLTIDK